MTINNIQKAILELEAQEEAAWLGITERKKKIKTIRTQLAKLRGTNGFPWSERAAECIDRFNCLSSSEEIIKCILFDRLDELNDKERRRGLITSLSVALNKLCNAGKLKSEKVYGLRGLFYGLPHWWDDKGNIQPFYRVTLENKIRNYDIKK
jgi:hypothetical protein